MMQQQCRHRGITPSEELSTCMDPCLLCSTGCWHLDLPACRTSLACAAQTATDRSPRRAAARGAGQAGPAAD